MLGKGYSGKKFAKLSREKKETASELVIKRYNLLFKMIKKEITSEELVELDNCNKELEKKYGMKLYSAKKMYGIIKRYSDIKRESTIKKYVRRMETNPEVFVISELKNVIPKKMKETEFNPNPAVFRSILEFRNRPRGKISRWRRDICNTAFVQIANKADRYEGKKRRMSMRELKKQIQQRLEYMKTNFMKTKEFRRNKRYWNSVFKTMNPEIFISVGVKNLAGEIKGSKKKIDLVKKEMDKYGPLYLSLKPSNRNFYSFGLFEANRKKVMTSYRIGRDMKVRHPSRLSRYTKLQDHIDGEILYMLNRFYLVGKALKKSGNFENFVSSLEGESFSKKRAFLSCIYYLSRDMEKNETPIRLLVGNMVYKRLTQGDEIRTLKDIYSILRNSKKLEDVATLYTMLEMEGVKIAKR